MHTAQLSHTLLAAGASLYDLSVSGPNGFLRRQRGGVAKSSTRVDTSTVYSPVPGDEAVTVTFQNAGKAAVTLKIADQYSGTSQTLTLAVGETQSLTWSLHRTFGWYDLQVSTASDASFLTRLAGHVETGKPSVSDPRMGGLKLKG